MNPPAPRPAWQVATLLVLALAAVLGGSLYARHRLAGGPRATAVSTDSAAVFEPARPLPAFRLRDDADHDADRSVFLGRWSIVFFGYTHCPDACPAALAELAAVDRKLADLAVADRPQVWLVSVDPRRDSPARLHEYVRFFNPAFRALTGEPAAVEALTRALGIPVVVRDPDAADYVVDHSAAMLLINPRAEVHALFPAPQRIDVLTADYRRLVAAASPARPAR